MQVAFFLLPKSELCYLQDDFTLRQALEKMQRNSLMALPILDKEGKYAGSITTADILWYIKDKHGLDLNKAANIPLMNIPRLRDNRPVKIDARIEDLLDAAMEENFIPVIDDLGVFIGMVRRRELLIQYQKEFAAKKE